FKYQKENKWDDPKADTFNSADVVQFAIDHNFYSGSVKDFSFSDVYNPVDFEGARFCDIRVWAFFNSASPKDFGGNKAYWDYAKGNVIRRQPYKKGMCQTKENFPTNRLPLWIKPELYVTIHGAINEMRNHLEGTELDMSKDAGAGPFGCPYRMRPLTWESGGEEYLNERVTATQQTGWVMAAQSRDWFPDHVGGIIWFATDDAANTVFAPFYCSITRVPEEYAEGNGSLTRWSDNSSFWVNNMISNFAYTRYNLIHPEIERVQQAQEKDFVAQTVKIDAAAQKYSDKKSAVDYLTKTCCDLGSDLVKQRKTLFQNLFMKYMDGNVKKTDDDFRFKTDADTPDIPALTQPGYGKEWQDDVARKTGDKLKVKN
ncbi:MAG: C69 family dipeptidase, partial [Bacteroidales bacterium]|nr:C69 family dipeptidase [Bacteroidales bacterium]